MRTTRGPIGLLAVLTLWLLAVLPCTASTESSPEASRNEPAAIADSQRLDLPSYRDPESPLPGAGATSQIFTAFGTVLGVLALGIYLYKRIALRGLRAARRDETIRILGRTYLGPKESLCLVQVGTDVLLLGQTGSGITLLHTLPSSVADTSAGREDGETTIGPFSGTEDRAPSSFAQAQRTALAGLESRLRRLNKLWGTEVRE